MDANPNSKEGRGARKRNSPSSARKTSEHLGVTDFNSESEFSLLSAALNLHEFKFEDETPQKPKEEKGKIDKVGLDVTALDRYNDEVRRYRKIVIEECRSLPSKVNLDTKTLEQLDVAIERLCRNAYYGTAKAQKLAEGALPLLIWLMNRKRFPDDFSVRVHKSVSEMCWTSNALKTRFCDAHGLTVLFYNMKKARKNKRVACWSVYTMSMIATGSAHAIEVAREISGLDEHVAEMSFEYYWNDWPVNFGMVLQAIIFGPHSVCPNEQWFQFV